MGIATAYAPYVDFAINGANENEARSGEALTVVGTITAGSDADGAYLSSAGSANYLKIPDPKLDRQLRSAGHMWVGKIKTTVSGSFAVLAGVVEGTSNPSLSIEYVAVNLQDTTGAVLNGCLSFYYRSNTDINNKGVIRTGAIGINDGNEHSFCIAQTKGTDDFEVWVDGVQQSITEAWAALSDQTIETTSGTLAREFFVFARNDNGTPVNYFPGKVYTLARIKSSDFSAEALSTDPSIIFDAAADVTAPALASATATATGNTTASGSVTTDEGNGTLYSVATTSATRPSKAQVKAGQDHASSAAVWSASQAISSTGAKSVSVTGLTASTTYYLHHMHEDAASNQSDVVSSASFTTEAEVVFAGTIAVTDALKNNTGTVLASQSGIKVSVLKVADLESVYETTVTTNASGILSDITNAAIVAGSYHVAIKLTDGSVGITGAIEAV